jgi:hypothetical protein
MTTDDKLAGRRLNLAALALPIAAGIAALLLFLFYLAQGRLFLKETAELDEVLRIVTQRAQIGRDFEARLPQLLDEQKRLATEYRGLTGRDFDWPGTTKHAIWNCDRLADTLPGPDSAYVRPSSGVWLWPLSRHIARRRSQLRGQCAELLRVEPIVRLYDQQSALIGELRRLRRDDHSEQ